MLINFMLKYRFYLLPIFLVIISVFQPFNFLFVLFAFWLFTKKPKFIIDINLALLVFFLVSYNIATETGGPVGRSVTIFFPVSFYVIGKYLTKVVKTKKEIILLILSFIISLNFIPIISFLINILLNGFDFSNLKLIGSNTQHNYTAFTLFCSFFAFNMGLFPIIFFQANDKQELKIKRITMRLSFIAIVIIGSIGQRTGFVILILCSLTYIITTTKTPINFIFKKLLPLLIIGSIVYFSFSTLITQTVIYQRFFISNKEEGVLSTRTDIWEQGFLALINNPLGGIGNFQTEGHLYAHNLWLDVGLRAGYIILIPLLLLSVLFINDNIKILKNHKPLNYSSFFLLISISILLTFMVEPIMQGYTIFFCSFAFFYGVLKGVLVLNKTKNDVI